MKVFSDLHHFDLYYSFQLLAQRLNLDLYRPIGIEWKTENFWNIDSDPEFIECILSKQDGKCSEILSKHENLVGKSWAVFSLHLPRIGEISCIGNGIYLVFDKSKEVVQQAITLEAFKSTKFDILISSLPQHFALFEKLRLLYQPQAKHIFHHAAIGWNIPNGAKNVMFNTLPSESIKNINTVYYKQEFDLNVFSVQTPVGGSLVRSYVHFSQTESVWNNLDLPSWTLEFVGKTLGLIKHIVIPSYQLANKIAESAFTLHIKPGGESYGHILHNSFAIGRPVIINGNDFKNTSAGELLTKDTCLDVSTTPIKEVRERLQYLFANPSAYIAMCNNVVKQFRSVVDFEQDAKNIQLFLENLQ